VHVNANKSIETGLINKGTHWDTSLSRYTYTFDANRVLQSWSSESYNQANGYWSQGQMTFYEYDTKGNKIKDSIVTTPLSPPNPLNYQNAGKREYTYNAHRQMISEASFNWKATTNQWQPVKVSVFYYEDTTTGISSVQPPLRLMVYPNPAGNTLYISGAAAVSYKIFNTEGKLVDEGMYDDHISIGQLPAGQYLLMTGNETPVSFIKN
jgi:hypothetical protein